MSDRLGCFPVLLILAPSGVKVEGVPIQKEPMQCSVFDSFDQRDDSEDGFVDIGGVYDATMLGDNQRIVKTMFEYTNLLTIHVCVL